MRHAAPIAVLLAVITLWGCAEEAPLRGSAEAERLPEGIVVMPGVMSGAKQSRLAGQRPMSAGELRTCAGTILALEAQGKSLEATDTELLRARRAIEAEERTLDGLRVKVDTRDGKQVDAFNARAESQRTAIRSHNRRVEAQNREVETYRVTRNEFLTRCSGRGYLPSDLDTLGAAEKDAVGRASSVSDIPASVVDYTREF